MRELILHALFLSHSSLFHPPHDPYEIYTAVKNNLSEYHVLLDNMGGICYLSEIYCGFMRCSTRITALPSLTVANYDLSEISVWCFTFFSSRNFVFNEFVRHFSAGELMFLNLSDFILSADQCFSFQLPGLIWCVNLHFYVYNWSETVNIDVAWNEIETRYETSLENKFQVIFCFKII